MDKLNVRLTKLDSTHNNLRTDVIEGYTFWYPELGGNFIMFSKPLDETLHYRQITTSQIQEVVSEVGFGKPLKVTFKTRNSKYQLEFLD